MGLIVNKLFKTCVACPSQWEGYLEDTSPIYIRYRWGRLIVQIGNPGETLEKVLNKKYIFNEQIGFGFDGDLSFKELKNVLKEKLVFSKDSEDKLIGGD